MVIRVACAIVARNGRFFVCQRPQGKADGLRWEFPGGKLEAGESPEATLLREIDEELGWRLKIEQALTAVLWSGGDRNIELLPFLCRPADQREPTLYEHVDSAWLSLAELKRLDMCEADKPILQDLERINLLADSLS